MASFPLIMQAWDEKHWSKPELIEQPELMQVKLVLRLDMNVPDQVLYKYPTSTDETIKLIKVIGDKVGSIKEIMLLIDLKDREHFMDKYLTPAIKGGYVQPLYSNSPHHPRQKYLLTEKGKEILNETD